MTDFPRPGASELMRSLGLLVDGPARWAAPVGSRKPGIFVVELPGGRDEAPLDLAALRRWIERVPSMRVDGESATLVALRDRLAEWWLPGETVMYVGRSTKQIGGRLAAIYATELGYTKPNSSGHWLKTLSVLNDLRVWWSETDALEEYEDALLSAVAERNDGRLPFANLSSPDGERKPHGIDASLREPTGPPTTQPTGSRLARRTPSRPTARPAARRPAATSMRRTVATAPPNPAEPTLLSREGLDRLTAELEHLRTEVRPGVIARVKAARELGDLRENADYEYARKEQSFVEGRIQAIEAMLRNSALIEDAPGAATTVAAVRLGSTVVVESDGEEQTWSIVGPAEADPSNGRISNVSPVGRALIGARAGDEVSVQLPAGSVVYRVIEIS